jgi:hypothetical protein
VRSSPLIVEQLAMRADPAQQRLGGLRGGVEPLPRDRVRPPPDGVLQRQVVLQLFQQLEVLVGVGFEIKRVDFGYPQLDLGQGRHRAYSTLPDASRRRLR